MFLRHSVKVQLDGPQKFIEGAALTYSSEVIAVSHNMKQTILWHYSREGKLLAKYSEEAPVLQFGCLTGAEFVYLLPRSHKIALLNVGNKERQQLTFRYLSESLYRCKLLLFSDTVHYCILERAEQTNSHRLTFLKYPAATVHRVFITNSEDFTFERLNHNSRLAYYCKLNNHFEIHVVDFLEQSTTSYVFERPSSNTVLRSVQELTPEQLLLLCYDPKFNYSCLVYNSESEKLRSFANDSQQLTNIFDVKVNGPYVYFYCYDKVEQKGSLANLKSGQLSGPRRAATATMYLFSRQNEQLVTKLACKVHNEYVYSAHSIDGCAMMLQSVFTHTDSSEIQLHTERIISQKELFVSMLKQLGSFSHSMIEYIIDAFSDEVI